MRKVIWRNGIIAGIILGAMFFVSGALLDSEAISPDKGELIGYLSMLIILGGSMFLTLRELRKGSSLLTFKWAFLACFFLAIIASVFYAIGWEIYYSTGNANEMMDAYYAQQMEKIEMSQKLTDEQKDIRLSQMKSMEDNYKNNRFFRIGFSTLEPLPMGLVLSIIFGFFMKKKTKVQAKF